MDKGSNLMAQGFTLWFTGLSGSGKSTLSEIIAKGLLHLGKNVEVLDGDEVRTHLSKGLTFSKEDRDINIRRIGFVCKLLSRNGVIAVSAAISPYRAVREEIRRDIGHFVEIYCKCSIEELSRRDVKGLYKKALAGEIPHFTGVSDPYEEPSNPEVTVRSDQEKAQDSADKIMSKLKDLKYLTADDLEKWRKYFKTENPR
jgi:adenylyl-sulfate kinase